MISYDGKSPESITLGALPEGYFYMTPVEAYALTNGKRWTKKELSVEALDTPLFVPDYDPHRLFFSSVIPDGKTPEEWFEEHVKPRSYCAMLKVNKGWNGKVYHYSRDPEKVLVEGYKIKGDVTGSNTNFGPGCYVFLDVADRQTAYEDLTLLVGDFTGDLYTCEYYDDDVEAEQFGYIPYGYDCIKWELQK